MNNNNISDDPCTVVLKWADGREETIPNVTNISYDGSMFFTLGGGCVEYHGYVHMDSFYEEEEG